MCPHLTWSFVLLLVLPLLSACTGESWKPSPSPPTAAPGGSSGTEEGSGGTNLGEIAGNDGTSGTAGSSGSLGKTGGVAGAGGAENAGEGGQEPGGEGQGGAGAGGDAGQGGADAGGQEGGEACQPGKFSCLGDLLRQCTEQGQFAPKEACGTKLCSAEQGKCMVCVPGSVKGCSSPEARGMCTEDGSGYAPVTCPEELPYCDQGECVACLDASGCPAPKSPCLQATCISGKCGVKPHPKGYLPEEQIPGDCQRRECDSKGELVLVFDDQDPPSSGSACYSYACQEGGGFSTVNTPAGMPCGEGCYCNGKGQYGKCIPGERSCNKNESVLVECTEDGSRVEILCMEELPACSEGACRGVTQIAAGGDHACVVLTNQRAHCWGRNHVGQLGLGTNNPTLSQYGAVVELTEVQSIAAGDHHTCAITKGGKVFCWGDNEFGQVGAGAGSLGYYTTPTEVKGLSEVTQISLGHGFSCALTKSGEVFCWGRNNWRQITFDGSYKDVFSPTLLSVEHAAQITAGSAHACALTKTGNVLCWGSCEFWQSIGSPSSPCGVSASGPQIVEGLLPGVTEVQAGGDHTCALSPGGVQCWGRNNKGQLGIEKSSVKEPPTLTAFPKPSKEGFLALGQDHTCLLADGGVSCVGWNKLGQLGRDYLPTPGVHPEFEVLPGAVRQQGTNNPMLSGVARISVGTDFSLALKADGNLLGWGNGQYGKTIGGGNVLEPTPYLIAFYILYVN
jgi:alpha-tubulin suppressor-like RCC1 family protein